MKAKLAPTKPCPCGSGETYGACCRPLHRAEREAPTPEALMRSRFSAFACGEIDHLIRTLAPEHEDRARPAADVARDLRENCRIGRFMGLEIFEASAHGDRGMVRFRARVFVDGRDRSFEERSDFRRVDGAWRYVGPLELS